MEGPISITCENKKSKLQLNQIIIRRFKDIIVFQ